MNRTSETHVHTRRMYPMSFLTLQILCRVCDVHHKSPRLFRQTWFRLRTCDATYNRCEVLTSCCLVPNDVSIIIFFDSERKKGHIKHMIYNSHHRTCTVFLVWGQHTLEASWGRMHFLGMYPGCQRMD